MSISFTCISVFTSYNNVSCCLSSPLTPVSSHFIEVSILQSLYFISLPLQDRTKCACIQMTIEATTASPGGHADETVGYKYRRLSEPILTG